MKKLAANATLKLKIETTLMNYLSNHLTGIDLVGGHERLPTVPERCVIVWARNVTPFDDMPISTGVRLVTVTVRIEVPNKDGDSIYDETIQRVTDALDDADSVRKFTNLGDRTRDDRPVRNVHVYDLDLESDPDARSDEYLIEDIQYSVVCGEHDG